MKTSKLSGNYRKVIMFFIFACSVVIVIAVLVLMNVADSYNLYNAQVLEGITVDSVFPFIYLLTVLTLTSALPFCILHIIFEFKLNVELVDVLETCMEKELPLQIQLLFYATIFYLTQGKEFNSCAFYTITSIYAVVRFLVRCTPFFVYHKKRMERN